MAKTGSLKACQRLYNNGIVLSTDKVWWEMGTTWILHPKMLCGSPMLTDDKCIPAPTMDEIWKELPEDTYILKGVDGTIAWKGEMTPEYDENPVDALIYLLLRMRVIRWCEE